MMRGTAKSVYVARDRGRVKRTSMNMETGGMPVLRECEAPSLFTIMDQLVFVGCQKQF